MPTGNFEDGLGSSRWVVSPGVTTGLILADWIQAFPILSYTYTSEPQSDSIPLDQKFDQHGMSFQSIIPIVFSEDFFMQFTPVFSVPNFKATSGYRYRQEVFASYTLTPKLQLTGFGGAVFEDKHHTIRVGLTTYF